jgi:hypothetical protein
MNIYKLRNRFGYRATFRLQSIQLDSPVTTLVATVISFGNLTVLLVKVPLALNVRSIELF